VTWILLTSLCVFPLTAILGAFYIRWMRSRALGQQIRELGPSSHFVKAGTPTMGGAVILLVWLAATVFLGITTGWPENLGFIVASGLGFGALGLIDDLLSVWKKRSTGLTGPQKLLLGSLIAILLFFVFHRQILGPQRIPFSSWTVGLPWWGGFLLTWILMVATTNSTNLTDGLDGLAGGVACLVLAGMLLLSPSHANLQMILPLLAALAGFLWLNTHPASLFMGDIGSFGIGGIIGALALSNGIAFLLPLLAGIFVIESVSVILQVGVKRVTGRRVFKMAPLHHHFEDARGRDAGHLIPAPAWTESKVTSRFLLLQMIFVLLAVWASRT
jgi:phospho-N-acetylmuramoyl-pentapeptide-transferase